MIKVGVVGGGAWGKNLIRNFYELGALTTICDSNKSLEKVYKEKYPEVSFESDYNKLVSSDVDAIVIATPAEQHYKMAMWAILHGKDVFVEKPLSLNVREADKLVTYAKVNDKILMVGHILQYHPAVVMLKELVDRGTLGTIEYIYSNRLNMGKIRTEENVLWSFAPHDISVILMLLKEMPTHVSCAGESYLQPTEEIADVTVTNLFFKSKVHAHIFVSWLHPFKEQKLIVVGNKNMAVFDDTIKDKLVLYPHSVEWQNKVPVVHKAEGKTFPISNMEPLNEECKRFIDSIQYRIQPKTNGEEGGRVLKILEKSQESLNQGGEKICV